MTISRRPLAGGTGLEAPAQTRDVWARQDLGMRGTATGVRAPQHASAAGGTVADVIGRATRAEIFGAVLTAGPITRTALADRLGLSPSSITRLLPPLLEAGYLREQAGAASGPGRPQRLLSVDVERHLVVGLKIAPTHVAGVVTDLGAQVLARDEVLLDASAPELALAASARLARRLLAAFPGAAGRVLGVGVGLGGHVAAETGRCRYSGILDWHDVDVAGPLASATGLPVAVGNDVNALVVAERWFGKGRDVESFAVVTIGPGIGCGLLLEGALYTGSTGLAAEFGHIPLDPAGPKCGCGRRGCLEALASSGAILARLRQAGVECAGIEEAAALARSSGTRPGTAGGQDAARAARAAFAAAGDALGRGLATLCNLVNPALVIVAGEGVAFHDLLRPALDDALAHHAFSTAGADCTVQIDPVNDDLWARGAACLVIRETVRAALS